MDLDTHHRQTVITPRVVTNASKKCNLMNRQLLLGAVSRRQDGGGKRQDGHPGKKNLSSLPGPLWQLGTFRSVREYEILSLC